MQGSYTAEVTSPYRQQSSNGPDVRGEFLPEELQSHQLPSPHTQHSGGVPDHSRVLTAPRSGDLRGSVDPMIDWNMMLFSYWVWVLLNLPIFSSNLRLNF